MDQGETLSALFRTACELGKMKEGFELLQNAALLRPTFDAAADLAERPGSVQLAAGEHTPKLVCFSSYVALAGVHQYARFASPFRGDRDVHALPAPGFVKGEALPNSVHAVAEVQADSVLRAAGGEPFVLLGSSSGGMLAHAAAELLDERGTPPLAVVLLDSYLPREDSPLDRFRDELFGGMFDREEVFAPMDVARLSAMSWYFRLLAGWSPAKLRCRSCWSARPSPRSPTSGWRPRSGRRTGTPPISSSTCRATTSPWSRTTPPPPPRPCAAGSPPPSRTEFHA